MAVNKVVYDGTTLIDLTGDTVTADKLMIGATAHDKAGNVITGEYKEIDISEETAVYTSELETQDDIIDQIAVVLESQFVVPSNLQSKSVTPSVSKQTVSADEGYDALSTVTVEAIPQSYTDQIYQNGYDAGNEVGYDAGNEVGYDVGYAQGTSDALKPYALKNYTVTASDTSLSAVLNGCVFVVDGTRITTASTSLQTVLSSIKMCFVMTTTFSNARKVSVNGVNIGTIKNAGEVFYHSVSITDGITIDVKFSA